MPGAAASLGVWRRERRTKTTSAGAPPARTSIEPR